MSSPRERGSSDSVEADEDDIDVVPARAGVILPLTRGLPHSNASSPRERGSSGGDLSPTAGLAVVPARAGVIRRRGRRRGPGRGRPRASGGHPVGEHLSFCRYIVVPARAGVIRLRSVRDRSPPSSSPRERGSSGLVAVRRPCEAGRPRASGGHPANIEDVLVTAESSPRERGSSAEHLCMGQAGEVVPARAGVIRSTRPAPGRMRRRPRASGGHPLRTEDDDLTPWSSPRERGSSAWYRAASVHQVVVPARAGVIRETCGWRHAPLSRPRASGGHPTYLVVSDWPSESSPRERGSSVPGGSRGAVQPVVPARAGVIRIQRVSVRRRGGRPRASGGHPRRRRVCVGGHRRPRASGGHPSALPMLVNMLRSSPRERGSSEQLEELRAGHAVVPARAGVIRATGRTTRRTCCRPRASGGHPDRHDWETPQTRSSPRERGSSAGGRDHRLPGVVVPARAGVIRRTR